MATLSCHKFTGVDVYNDPGDLPNGGLTTAYNVYIEGGNAKTRAGIVGLLTTPMANPIYSPFPYIKNDGSEWIIFCSGPASSTTGGKIYQVAKAGGVATEILDATNGSASFNFNAEAFRIAQGGDYAYMCWGAALYRTDLETSTAAATTGMNPPVYAPVARLSNVVLDALSSTSGITGDTLATASAYMPTSQTMINAAPGGNIPDGNTLGGTAPNQWTAIGNTPSTGTPPTAYTSLVDANSVTCSNWFNLDNPGGGFQTGLLPVGALSAPVAYRNATQFYMSCYWYTNDTSSTQKLKLGCQPFGSLPGTASANGTTTTLKTTVNVPVNSIITMLTGTAGNINESAVVTASSLTSGTYTLTISALTSSTTLGDTFRYSSSALGPISYYTPSTMPYSGQTAGQILETVFDFNGLGTSIDFVQFSIVGADGNFSASGNNMYPFCAGFTFAAVDTAGAVTVTPAAGGGVVVAHHEPTKAYWGALGGVYLTKDYGGSLQNWSAAPVITFNLASAPGANYTVTELVAAGLNMDLVLRQSGSTTEYVAPLSVSSDGTYMSVDLSAYISPSIYDSFEYWSIEFTSSLNVNQSTSTLFTITSITQAGNLPVSTGSISYAPISYQCEELNDVGDATLADPIESAGGPVSNAIQPTAVYAIGMATAPVPVNPSTTHIAFYRIGGTYNDGYARLIATVPIGSDYAAPILYSDLVIDGTTNTKVSSVLRPFIAGDVGKVLYILGGTGFNQGPLTVASVATGVATLSGSAGILSSTAGFGQLGGDTLNRDLQNPYVTWNHTTRTLTDNTPDGFLNLAETLQYGRDLPPTACSAVVSHQNRIFVADGQTLSGSWDLVADTQNGLYFTNVDLSTDPNAQVKGVTFAVRPGDNDNIAAMLSCGSSLLVLKSRSAAVVDGYDGSNFACQTYLTDAGLGCVAGRAAIVCSDKALFLGPDSVYQFDGNATVPHSIPIQPLLHPDGLDGGATIPATAFSKCAMMYYNMRLHVFAPAAGGSANSVCYVHDFRNGAWTTYGLAMTSGASLTGSTDGAGAYMGGLDGQLYTFAPGGDKASPSSSPVAIPFKVTPRGMGEEQQTFSPSGEIGMNFIEVNHASRMYAMGKVPANTLLTLYCYPDGLSGGGFSTSYTASGAFVVQQPTGGVQGLQIFAGVSGAVLTQATIRALGVENEKRKVPR